jgi:hypothetical protein
MSPTATISAAMTTEGARDERAAKLRSAVAAFARAGSFLAVVPGGATGSTGGAVGAPGGAMRYGSPTSAVSRPQLGQNRMPATRAFPQRGQKRGPESVVNGRTLAPRTETGPRPAAILSYRASDTPLVRQNSHSPTRVVISATDGPDPAQYPASAHHLSAHRARIVLRRSLAARPEVRLTPAACVTPPRLVSETNSRLGVRCSGTWPDPGRDQCRSGLVRVGTSAAWGPSRGWPSRSRRTIRRPRAGRRVECPRTRTRPARIRDGPAG